MGARARRSPSVQRFCEHLDIRRRARYGLYLVVRPPSSRMRQVPLNLGTHAGSASRTAQVNHRAERRRSRPHPGPREFRVVEWGSHTAT